MSKSAGRRIKRAIYIDMNSVRFCTPEMFEKFNKFNSLREYLQKKQAEIDLYNKEHNIEKSSPPNGRQQTNIGIFRAYLKDYLINHPKINQNMTLLVRHLPPTPRGIPIEIYAFSKDKAWANYEDIQADIFDYIIAVLPKFGLRVFQEPSGIDFQPLNAPD
jgi:miniconductance mechanosensitive channel